MAVLGASVVGVSTTFAAHAGQAQEERFADLITALAEKFNLDTDEVQAVFDEQREVHQEEMREQHEMLFEEKLAQAVEDGGLTQEQADAIIEKMEEMRDSMEAYKDLAPEERKEAMQGHAEDLKTWAEEQGIDMKYLHMGPPPQRGVNGQPHFQPQEQAP